MRKFLSVVFIAMPLAAFANHGDVIEVQLNEGCSLKEYLQIKDDFNANWGRKNGYRAEVYVPVQADKLTSIYWVGRSADAAAFGKAWDTWRKDLDNPDSVAAKLWARFSACSTNISRRGYDVL